MPDLPYLLALLAVIVAAGFIVGWLERRLNRKRSAEEVEKEKDDMQQW